MIYIRHKFYSYSPSHSIQILLFAAFFTFFMALPVLSMAGTVELPQTGQTTCYDEDGNVISCTDTGQDGDIQAGVAWPSPRFTDNGDIMVDSTVTDNLTGLVWAQDANLPGGTQTWQEALDYVAEMNAGTYENFGDTDWRLPNVNELESLINAEAADPATWLNVQGFTNVQSVNYWSSTSDASSNDAWGVGMGNGDVVDISKTLDSYVWPVRSLQEDGGQAGTVELPETGQTAIYATGDDGDVQSGVEWPDQRFTDNGDSTVDSTVTDKLTGLVWAQDANLPGGQTWQEALDYVAGMNAGTYENFGYTDWRLPNRKELFSLIDRSYASPALQSGHPFTNVQLDYYWSSTSYADATPTPTPNAWRINMVDGYVGNGDKVGYYYVWPVRLHNSDISVSPASHDFGNVTVGDTSTAQSFTVSNNGDADLVIDTISLIGTDVTDFSIQFDNCSGLTFAPSDTCSVDVVFSPITDGNKSSNFVIPSNDPDTPTLAVPLSGNTCDYSISPTSESFDSSGGIERVSISTDDVCDWTATSTDTWITIVLNSSGTGNGIVGYSVSENTDTSSRTGTMTIAGKTFTVTQEGSDTDVLSAPANFSATVEECTTSPLGTSCPVSMGWTSVSAATGYKLYYGYSSGSYEAPIDLGNVTSVTYNGIPESTYYLAISAYDSSGNESNKSDEIVLTVGESSVPTNFNAIMSDCTVDTGITCTVSLSWTGVSGSSGYKLYYGFSSGNYASSIDVGNVTSLTYAGISDGIYYLALTAYDSEGVESDYSDELILEVGSGSSSVNKAEKSPSPFAR